MIALSGVRNSCDMLARNVPFASLAASAARRASVSLSSRSLTSLKSLISRKKPPSLSPAPPGLFPVDHLANILLHYRHRAQQHAGLVLAARRDRRLQFARGDAVGDCRRVAQRADDAPPQDEGDPGGQEERQQQRAGARILEKLDIGHDPAALHEAVPR